MPPIVLKLRSVMTLGCACNALARDLAKVIFAIRNKSAPAKCFGTPAFAPHAFEARWIRKKVVSGPTGRPCGPLTKHASRCRAATRESQGFADIFSISFIWGSVDSYNTLQFLDGLGNPLAGGTFVGGDIFNPANGNQTDPNTNPLVTFHFTGSDVSNVAGIRLTSNGQNAFETDNYTINALPEPGTWAMMMLGLESSDSRCVAARRRSRS